MSAEERLRRILSMVPWIQQADPTVDEICARFAITQDQLVHDLALLSFCGVAPFTPDVMIEADIVGDHVSLRMADWFRRPLRLTSPEALALVASAQAMLAAVRSGDGTSGPGPLDRALSKVASVLGIAPGEDVDVELGDAAGSVLATVQQAARARSQIELDYYSFGRDEWSVRVVDPWLVFSRSGAWYVRGHCHQAGGERLFRVDRIRSAVVLDTAFEPPADPGRPAVFEPRPDVPTVVLEVSPKASWVAGQYPNVGVESRARGRQRITLAVSEPAWLERLLVTLGPDAKVVKAPAELAGAAASAAERILRRYPHPPT